MAWGGGGGGGCLLYPQKLVKLNHQYNRLVRLVHAICFHRFGFSPPRHCERFLFIENNGDVIYNQ